MVMVLWKLAPKEEKNDDYDQDFLTKIATRMVMVIWKYFFTFAFPDSKEGSCGGRCLAPLCLISGGDEFPITDAESRCRKN